MPSRDPPPALPHRLEQHLARSGLVGSGDRVLVAVSGGLDSTVLLHLLRFPLRHLRLRISAAHLDHAMRPDSAADALWVRGLCAAWDVPLVVERLAAAPETEAEARERRYAFLERVAPVDAAIATGHHLHDQAETVLFRIRRGAGVRGLRGIAPRRGRVIRPLLPFGRDELEAYARSQRIAHRRDPTNLDLTFARNRLRHVVLPSLEAARPGTTRALARLADAARRAERRWRPVVRRLAREATIEASAEGAALARDVLRSYHPLVRARVLRLVLRRHGSMPGRAGTQAALEFINSGPSGGQLHLPGGIRLERDFDSIRIARPREDEREDRELRIAAAARGSGRIRLAGRAYDVRWGPGPLEGPKTGVPPDTAFPLSLRAWAPGDRIRLAYGSKKLKKLFAERRLDRRTRVSTPVLAAADGRVLWVPGVARAAGVPDGGGFEIAVRDAEQQ